MRDAGNGERGDSRTDGTTSSDAIHVIDANDLDDILDCDDVRDWARRLATRQPLALMPGRSRQIFVVRHGLAEASASGGDAERPLSVEGKVRLRQIAQGLVALDVHFDLILCSPLKRAQQTAAILADAFEPRPRLVVSDALAPGGSVSVVAGEIDRYRRHLEIAIVGHEPGIGKLAAYLVGSRMPMPFKRGAVACVEVAGPAASQNGQLRWFATPKMLRSLEQ